MKICRSAPDNKEENLRQTKCLLKDANYQTPADATPESVVYSRQPGSILNRCPDRTCSILWERTRN